MSLDVGIKVGDDVKYQMSFDDDGYYWYLYPLFEKMYQRIGIYIDLYGDATFNSSNMIHLEDLIEEAKKQVEKEPFVWKVHLGTQTHPKKKERYKEVRKEEFLAKLQLLSSMVNQAKKPSCKLVFIGD